MATSKQEKAPTIWQLYLEGDFIDAKDNQGDWRVGYIVSKFEHLRTFKIRFDGWSSKYDETFKHNSFKLQPFREIVVGYTGQVQNPAVREDWKFNSQKHQERLEQLKTILADPQRHTVHIINQQLRGQNYLYTDFLMTCKFSLELIGLPLEYFKTNVAFLAYYLKTIHHCLQEYLTVISHGKTIDLWTPRQAFFKAYFQVFDTNYTIWGCYARLQGFFRDNGELLRPKIIGQNSKKQPKRLWQMHMTQLFLNEGGFDALRGIIQSLLETQQFIQFLFLHSLTNLLSAVYICIQQPQREIVVEQLLQIGDNNLAKLGESQLKELHRHNVSNFFNALVALSARTKYEQTICQWTTERQLKLALKMMVCPYFEKKLKGVGYMGELIQREEWLIKTGFFQKWAEHNGLYETLFVGNDNQEFAKKSCELAKLLFLRNGLSDANIDLILQSRKGKHETILKEIYALLAQFALYQPNLQQKLSLFSKVADLPQEQWDQDYIHMIREFSENAYGLSIREKLTEPFGFQMIYQYTIRVQSEFSLGELLHILSRVEKSKIYSKFQEDCFARIAEGNKTAIHLRILLLICHNRIDSFDRLKCNLIKTVVDCILIEADTDHHKIIEDALLLLGEITKNTSRQIQVEKIGLMWDKLASSQHRNAFMNWLFKKKENGRVTINHSLNQQHRRYLLSTLWNTPQQIKSIDFNQAIFMIQLFKNVNIFENKMSRCNIVIRPTSFELQAYQKLWTVLKDTENELVAELFCQLLSQIHCCYQQQSLTQSIENLVENIALSIKTDMEGGQIGFMTRLLKLTEKLIYRQEQMFDWNYVPKVSYFREYTVLNRDTDETKVLRFNCMQTFFELKKLISQKFGVPIYKLSVFSSRQQQLKLQSYFKIINELMLPSPKFQISTNLDYQSLVKTCLNRKLDLFFELLDDQRIQKLVWSIVEKLPISDDLKFKLYETQNLLAELGKVGFYKEVYELKVVAQLDHQWWEKFVSEDNLDQLTAKLHKTSFKTHIELQYTSILSEIIAKMLTICFQSHKVINISHDFVDKIFNILTNLLISIQKDGSRSLQLQVKTIKNLFSILDSLNDLENISICQKLSKSNECELLLETGLIRMPHLIIRKTLYQQLKVLFRTIDDSLNQSYLEILMINLFRLAVSSSKTSNLKQYFLFTSYFLSLLSKDDLKVFSQGKGKGICQNILKLAEIQRPQLTAQNPNVLFIGQLSLLKYLVPCQESALQEYIVNFVLIKCLFADNESICKSKQSRSQSLSLLRTLLLSNSKIVEDVCRYLIEFHRKGQWRTRKIDDWTISLNDKMKSATGYVGIKNLGCICYMNSFMQQLYMIPRFRRSIISCEWGCIQPTASELLENLLFQVQKMFVNLQLSEKKFYDPRQFCIAFKDYEGNPTNVSEQMDIDQYSNILFDRLDHQMKGSSQPSLIRDMFEGIFSNEIVCKGCPHYSQTEQHFLSISLTVKNKKNIYQSLDTMVKGDMLDGDNAYFCERCNKLVSAIKRVSFKKLPDYLICTLKRFQFDYEKMAKLKVNDYCEFPQQLDLQLYSRQHLRKQQNAKVQDDQEALPSHYFKYQLKGIVVHLGYADSGHYYSFAQDRQSQKWLEFNDTIVRNFSIDDIAQQAFGGETGGYQSKQKIKNAYMLIYQRELKKEQISQINSTPEQLALRTWAKPVLAQIFGQNKQQKIQNILFSHQYGQFVQELLDQLHRFRSSDQVTILQYAITVFLTIILREKTDSAITPTLKKISLRIQQYSQLKQWILALFTQRNVFDEYFINCPVKEVKKTIAYWLVSLYLECSHQNQQLFCNLLLTRITEDNQNMFQPCLILYEISKKDVKTLDYLVQQGLVGRYLENIVRKDPRMFVGHLKINQATDCPIGKQTILQRKEDPSKRLKLDNDNGYIWAIINLIIERAQQIETPLQAYLIPKEVQYLLLPDSKILKIMEQIKCKFQLHAFTNLLSYLSLNNKQIVQTLTRIIAQGLKDFQSKRYRQFFLLFEKLINIQDSLTHLRLQAFNSLQEGLLHNEKYSLDSNIIQQWIIILINRNQALRTYLMADPTLLNFLMKMATKKIPSQDVARKNNAYGQFMINKLHGVKFPRSKKGYIKLSQDMTAFYEQIIDNRFQQSNIWPSLPQTESVQLQVGDAIAYFDIKDKIDYEEAKVESIFLGKFQLLLKKNKAVHAWKNDEKISLDVMLINNESDNELDSSRTTQMEVEDDEDYFDDL